MELFDVFDKNRNFLNYRKERGTKLDINEYNQGAEIWIVNDNKILLAERSINKSHPLIWEVPGGCSIAGENTIDTIVRELKEELNIDLKKEKVYLLNTHIYKQQFVDIYFYSEFVDVSLIDLQLEEVSNYKFVSLNEFLNMKNCNQITPCTIKSFEIIKEKLNI